MVLQAFSIGSYCFTFTPYYAYVFIKEFNSRLRAPAYSKQVEFDIR